MPFIGDPQEMSKKCAEIRSPHRATADSRQPTADSRQPTANSRKGRSADTAAANSRAFPSNRAIQAPHKENQAEPENGTKKGFRVELVFRRLRDSPRATFRMTGSRDPVNKFLERLFDIHTTPTIDTPRTDMMSSVDPGIYRLDRAVK